MTHDIEQQLAQLRLTTSPQLDQRVLDDAFAAMDDPADGPQSNQTSKSPFMIKRIKQLAAAAVILIGVAATFIWFTATNGGATIAFADVVDNMQNASSISFETVLTRPGEPEIRYRSELEGARYRKTDLTNGSIQIADGDLEKLVNIDPRRKSVQVSSYQKQTDNPVQSILGLIDEWLEHDQQDLGEKMLDGHQTIGFRVNTIDEIQRRQTIDVWVDTQTSYPVRIEMLYPQAGVELILTDFLWNPDLDDALFDLTPPEGYALEDFSR